MGAHALGAAAYAAKAAGLATPDQPEAVSEEIRWQLGHVTAAVRAALRQLPPVGENSSGPLGPGLLAAGLLGTIIRELQAGLADPAHPLTPDQRPTRETEKQKHSLSTRALRSALPSARPLLSPIQHRWQATPAPAFAPARALGDPRIRP